MFITCFHYCYSAEYVTLANYYRRIFVFYILSNSGQYKKHRENVLAVRRLKHNGLVTICREKKWSICDMKYLLQKLSHTSSSSSIGNSTLSKYWNQKKEKYRNFGKISEDRKKNGKYRDIGISGYRKSIPSLNYHKKEIE